MKYYELVDWGGNPLALFRRDDETTVEEVRLSDGSWVSSSDYVAQSLVDGNPMLEEVEEPADA